MGCTKIVKATKVDGIYDSDPNINSNAKLIKEISYTEVINKNLRVMDLTAITLCEENEMPIRVFDGTKEDNIYKVLTGDKLGTVIK